MSRTTRHVITLGAALAVIIVCCAVPTAAVAHEKWFFDPAGHPLRWDLFFTPLPLTFAGGVVLATIVAAIVWAKRGYRDIIPGPEIFGTTPAARRFIYGLLPLIVGIHFAVPLLDDGTQTTLFSPNDKLHGGIAYVLGVIEVFIALAFFYGGLTRLAAVALAGCWVAGFFVTGPETMLENSEMLGVAAFFFMAGRGPIAIDRLMFPRLEPSPALMRHAVLPLRIGLGLSLTVVAFTEKFANAPLALDFLAKNALNFTPALGLAMPDSIFVLCAAAVELTVGLWIMFGIFPREIIIIAWLPFNLTLSVFNQTELIGHLPIYGIMALLLIWIPGERNLDEWVAGVRGTKLIRVADAPERRGARG